MLSVRSQRFDKKYIKHVLLNTKLKIEYTTYDHVVPMYLMEYILRLEEEQMEELWREFGFPKDIGTYGFKLTVLYYILVNQELVSRFYKRYSIEKKYLDEYRQYLSNPIQFLKNHKNMKDMDDAAIFFATVYDIDPLYSNKRLVNLPLPYLKNEINQKMKESRFTFLKYFFHTPSEQNPVTLVNKNNKIIRYLTYANCVLLAKWYEIVYDPKIIWGNKDNYIQYFCEHYDPAILQGSPTQLENIYRHKICFEPTKKVKTIEEATKIEKIEVPVICDYHHIYFLIFDNEYKPSVNQYDNPKLDPTFKKYIDQKLVNTFQDDESILNTLNYLYFHTRSGIYCEIRDGKLRKFFLFANPCYENNWEDVKFRGFKNFRNMTIQEMLKAEPEEDLTMEEYKMFKSYYITKLNAFNGIAHGRKPENLIDVKNWWANAFIINNVMKKFDDSPIIDTAHCDVMVDFLTNLCEKRNIKNARFFWNKRDHPVLREDRKGPYTFMSDKKIGFLDRFAPILSWTGSEEFSDILCPNIDDFTVTLDYVPLISKEILMKPIEENRRKQNVPWDERMEKVIFRGSTTGVPRASRNQRIQLTKKFDKDPRFDVGISLVNYRDKVQVPRLIEFTMDNVQLATSIPMTEQMKYKYVINCDGHAGAYRLLTLHYLGFLVFKIDSLPERKSIGTLWADLILQKNKDYVPVKSDLSNLSDQVDEYMNHPEKAKRILKSSEEKRKTSLSRNGMLDYMEYLINCME